MKTIAELTVEELAQLIRQIVHEELKGVCTIDEKGYLVFRDEASYARYVQVVGKKPSRVKAYWIDEHGLKTRYSDDEVTPQLKRELERARHELTIPAEAVIAKLRKLGVKV
ncbi:hypothetical protein HRbin07_00107 [bacterium HR07]|mgnify:CR=1 FL=1|uniref:Uncharacterized protein n=1 Tax=Acetithermum autotrophicum TaxID=1446466 RepID=H5SRI8_ACEAU|nr:hypothetical protein HGMM_OP2C253 [Candidatus Acetothermum autotrophicum]GBC75915.1 hypothetical protein HRbin07_00107 [bacterium HR07]